MTLHRIHMLQFLDAQGATSKSMLLASLPGCVSQQLLVSLPVNLHLQLLRS